MIIGPKSEELAHKLREIIQSETDTISDGEGVAILLLWSFYLDHAMCNDCDIEELARDQLEYFMAFAKENIVHQPPH